jgi:hypothetical protein
MSDSFPWYQPVPQDDRLCQGEIILECPVARWRNEPFDEGGLQALVEYVRVDVVVMSQDCDLENRKISSIILCPAYQLSEWMASWKEHMELRKQNPSDNAWNKQVKNIADGAEVALSLIEELPEGFGGEKKVIDFKDVHTVPRAFLESMVQKRSSRLMLRPPYREHLSQSFARFFMRVGLPTPISLP